jgi:hypothetical protein
MAEYCISKMKAFEGGPDGALDYTTFANSVYGN